MKKLLMIFLIALSSGCANKKIGPPPIIPKCGFVNHGNPYAYCRPSDDGSKRWSVHLDESQSGEWVMTTVNGYSLGYEYGKKVEKYIKDLEDEIKFLKRKK